MSKYCHTVNQVRLVIFYLTFFSGLAYCIGGGFSTLEMDGSTYSNISKVFLSDNGKVVIYYDGGAASANITNIPQRFLESWFGRDKLTNILSAAKERAIQSAQLAVKRESQATELAIRAGCFREVDGLVYDTRKKQSGWVQLLNAKVFQIFDGGALIDMQPFNYESRTVAYVKNLPASVGDTDYLNVFAMPTGSYTYINKAGDSRTVHAYDCGRVCEREEIPQTVLTGARPFDSLVTDGKPQKDVVSQLPDSEELHSSGSGFFISEDGFFITNDHVVRNARRVSLKIDNATLKAKVVKENPTSDLALLKADGHFIPLSLSSSDADLGQAVFTIGFPDIRLQGTEPKYTDGKISSGSGLRDDPTEYQISVPVQPGNSGGPLVDVEGNVKGVIVARLDDFAALRTMGSLPQNVNYAIKASVLREFLSQFHEINLTNKAVQPNTVVTNVKKAVALVLVY